MSGEKSLTSSELKALLKEWTGEIQKTRHDNNDHISEVIGELRVEHNDMREVLVELQKNDVTLTYLCESVEKTLKMIVEDLKIKCIANEAEIKDHKKNFYEHPAIKEHGVLVKRVNDNEKTTEEQQNVQNKHTWWFACSFGAIVVAQVVWNAVKSPVINKVLE